MNIRKLEGDNMDINKAAKKILKALSFEEIDVEKSL